jgi:hypothetical protein
MRLGQYPIPTTIPAQKPMHYDDEQDAAFVRPAPEDRTPATHPDNPRRRRLEQNPQRPVRDAWSQGDATAAELKLTPQEQRIVDYHRKTLLTNTSAFDAAGRQITVYSTGIEIPEGPHKGEFVAVPGFVNGKVLKDEGELYRHWKKEIDAGHWPIYPSGEALNSRAQAIHAIMEQDVN